MLFSKRKNEMCPRPDTIKINGQTFSFVNSFFYNLLYSTKIKDEEGFFKILDVTIKDEDSFILFSTIFWTETLIRSLSNIYSIVDCLMTRWIEYLVIGNRYEDINSLTKESTELSPLFFAIVSYLKKRKESEFPTAIVNINPSFFDRSSVFDTEIIKNVYDQNYADILSEILKRNFNTELIVNYFYSVYPLNSFIVKIINRGEDSFKEILSPRIKDSLAYKIHAGLFLDLMTLLLLILQLHGSQNFKLFDYFVTSIFGFPGSMSYCNTGGPYRIPWFSSDISIDDTHYTGGAKVAEKITINYIGEIIHDIINFGFINNPNSNLTLLFDAFEIVKKQFDFNNLSADFLNTTMWNFPDNIFRFSIPWSLVSPYDTFRYHMGNLLKSDFDEGNRHCPNYLGFWRMNQEIPSVLNNLEISDFSELEGIFYKDLPSYNLIGELLDNPSINYDCFPKKDSCFLEYLVDSEKVCFSNPGLLTSVVVYLFTTTERDKNNWSLLKYLIDIAKHTPTEVMDKFLQNFPFKVIDVQKHILPFLFLKYLLGENILKLEIDYLKDEFFYDYLNSMLLQVGEPEKSSVFFCSFMFLKTLIKNINFSILEKMDTHVFNNYNSIKTVPNQNAYYSFMYFVAQCILIHKKSFLKIFCVFPTFKTQQILLDSDYFKDLSVDDNMFIYKHIASTKTTFQEINPLLIHLVIKMDKKGYNLENVCFINEHVLELLKGSPKQDIIKLGKFVSTFGLIKDFQTLLNEFEEIKNDINLPLKAGEHILRATKSPSLPIVKSFFPENSEIFQPLVSLALDQDIKYGFLDEVLESCAILKRSKLHEQEAKRLLWAMAQKTTLHNNSFEKIFSLCKVNDAILKELLSIVQYDSDLLLLIASKMSNLDLNDLELLNSVTT